MSLKIKNWDKFQHFKDRSPPWIKLHKCLIDDPDWHELPAEAAKILVMLWVIASEDETRKGCLPESKKLAFRLRISEKSLKSITSQLNNFLIQDDIKMISEGYQVDDPETETETETDIVLDIIQYLNSKTNNDYRNVESNRRLIQSRLNEGATPEQIKSVIDAKCNEWLDDKKMCAYLRPITLFSASKFESYLGALNNRSSNVSLFSGALGYVG